MGTCLELADQIGKDQIRERECLDLDRKQDKILVVQRMIPLSKILCGVMVVMSLFLIKPVVWAKSMAPQPNSKIKWSSIPIPDVLAQQLAKEVLQNYPPPQDIRASLEKTPNLYFLTVALDLNSDGTQELIAQNNFDGNSFCMAHNCPLWIFRQEGQKYQLLLQAYGGYIEPIVPLSTATNGYWDVMTREHSSASTRVLRLFKFDGKRYAPSRCLQEIYHSDKEDAAPELKPCPCDRC